MSESKEMTFINEPVKARLKGLEAEQVSAFNRITEAARTVLGQNYKLDCVALMDSPSTYIIESYFNEYVVNTLPSHITPDKAGMVNTQTGFVSGELEVIKRQFEKAGRSMIRGSVKVTPSGIKLVLAPKDYTSTVKNPELYKATEELVIAFNKLFEMHEHSSISTVISTKFNHTIKEGIEGWEVNKLNFI